MGKRRVALTTQQGQGKHINQRAYRRQYRQKKVLHAEKEASSERIGKHGRSTGYLFLGFLFTMLVALSIGTATAELEENATPLLTPSSTATIKHHNSSPLTSTSQLDYHPLHSSSLSPSTSLGISSWLSSARILEDATGSDVQELCSSRDDKSLADTNAESRAAAEQATKGADAIKKATGFDKVSESFDKDVHEL